MDKATLQQALAFIGKKLDVLSGKEKLDISIGHVDAKMDMSETNTLLRKILARDENITVTIEVI